MRTTIILAAVATTIVGGDGDVERSRVDAQSPTSATRGVPRFRVDPAWPKIPNAWQFGQVSSVSVERRITSGYCSDPARSSRTKRAKAAPPVLQFTAEGTFVRAWGGPGRI